MRIQEFYQYFLKAGKVCTDSRKIAGDSIFLALKGENFNGNKFVAEALEKGCSMAVADEDLKLNDDRIIQVPDVLTFLQQLASFHRSILDIPVIGITGTNGKTTTKELINTVLSSKMNVCATKGNLNNHIGVPLSLLEINSKTEVAIIEMGANHVGEIEILCEIAKPTHGLITNIGKAHLEGFGSPEKVVRAKNELYEYIRKTNGEVFVNIDDRLLASLTRGIDQTTYGKSAGANISGIDAADVFSSVKWKNPPEVPDWQIANTRLVGRYNFNNILSSICIGRYFGIEPESINNSLNSYEPGLNRSQYLESKNNRLVLDAYNANPDSMLAALRNFREMQGDDKLVILGDMFELGPFSFEAHRDIIRELEDSGFDQVMLAGQEFAKHDGTGNFAFFHDIEHLTERLKSEQVKGKLILIKGSRGMRMERLLDFL